MSDIPLNHKTIFLFDYSSHLAVSCNESFIFDVPPKTKNASSTNAQQLLPPITKTMWTCAIEAAIEYARVVYDLFPRDKLISVAVSKPDLNAPLNNWNEQGYDHLLNIMGLIPPPLNTTQHRSYDEMTNLTKTFEYCLKLIAQPSELQVKLMLKNSKIANSARIILFTSAKDRNLDKIQDILSNSIEEFNRILTNLNKNSLQISKCELCIVDLIQSDQKQMLFPTEIRKKRPPYLITRFLSSQTGSWLSKTTILLAQKFYDLVVTSITHIPMKEESNANSSANYDVEILHEKSVHDKLRVCGLLNNCIQTKEGLKTVCLKWSNPKTNITEFNFASHAYRISPLDVNSRPTSCLTTFILSGRCVVLEAGSQTRTPSHVLCNYANEIFIYCLSCFTKTVDDSRPSLMDQYVNKTNDYRISDFSEFIKANRFLSLSKNENLNFPLDSEKKAKCFTTTLEIGTRKWPINLSDSVITTVKELKTIAKHLSEKTLTVAQYNECIECIQSLQTLENKNESLVFVKIPKTMKNLKKKEQWKQMWCELDSLTREYQDVSDRHRLLYANISKITRNYVQQQQESNNIAINLTKKDAIFNKNDIEMEENLVSSNYDEEKSQKKQRITLNQYQNGTLFDIWSSRTKLNAKQTKEFYGRAMCNGLNPAPLYINLKTDESNVGKKV